MKRFLTAALLIGACAAQADLLIGSPEMAPTSIGPDAAIHEDWGAISVRLEPIPADAATEQRHENVPMPAVASTTSAGPLTLKQCVYRSPIWPVGADILVLKAEAKEEVAATLRVDVPETVSVGERLGVAGGRPVFYVLAGPKLERSMKPWGCTGGVAALPGWATPNAECDPAFKNIRAGMGGVPIEYRFAVPPGEKRTVVLGFCESFHPGAGIRPLRVAVEGTPEQDLDPIAAWGRHVPGCMRFDAVDADNDGYLNVAVLPHPAASDKNPILNAAWVFKPDVPVDVDQVKLGKANEAAEYFVDAGGAKDQSIYENGPVAYHVTLAPDRPVEMTFLLAAPGGAVPTPPTAWTQEKLFHAAVEAWGDWLDNGRNSLLDDAAAAEREALFNIALTRIQSGGFFLAAPVERYTAAQAADAIARLDTAELFDEAERLLRVYWDKEAPAPLAPFAQQADASWRDTVNDPAASAHILRALANHALATKDLFWVDKAWPAMKAGADALAKNPTSDAANAAIQAVGQVQALDPARFK